MHELFSHSIIRSFESLSRVTFHSLTRCTQEDVEEILRSKVLSSLSGVTLAHATTHHINGVLTCYIDLLFPADYSIEQFNQTIDRVRTELKANIVELNDVHVFAKLQQSN